jgi:hypothetical protein
VDAARVGFDASSTAAADPGEDAAAADALEVSAAPSPTNAIKLISNDEASCRICDARFVLGGSCGALTTVGCRG